MSISLLLKSLRTVFTFFCLFFYSCLLAQTSATSTKAGTINTPANGSILWNNAAKVQAEDNVFATSLISGPNKSSSNLDALNWGFQSTDATAANFIPSDASINGIKVLVKRKKSLSGSAKDQTVKLMSNGAEAGSNRAQSIVWPTSNSFATYGNEIDLWGTALKPAQLTSSTFGVRLAVRNQGRKDVQAEIDYIQIIVYFNQTIFYSKSTGTLETLATWGTNADGSGTAPASFTHNGQLFTLQNRPGATLTANLTISGVNSGLVVGDGTNATTLTIPSNFALTSRVNVKDNSSLIISNTTIPAISAIGIGTTVTYNAAANQTIADALYYNLSLGGSGTKYFTTNTAGATTIANQLSIDAGVTADNQGDKIVVTGTFQPVINNGAAVGTGYYMCTVNDANPVIAGNGKFSNLEIDASSSDNTTKSITLSNPVVVNSALLLTDGILANGANLTMASGSVINVADGTLGSALTSSGYDVTYLSAAATSVSAGNELSGAVTNLNVQLTGGSTLTLKKNLVLSGNLTLTSGTLDVSNNNYGITVSGNVVVNSTLAARNSTFTFNGSGVQKLSGSNALSLYGLTINNATGGSVQIAVPVTITNALSLTNGIVTTSSSSALTLAADASVSGGSSKSYINGPIIVTLSATSGTLTFPIGKNNAYRPITLSVNQKTTAATQYSAEVFSGAAPSRTLPASLQSLSSVRYYTVTPSNYANVQSAVITLSYGADDNVVNPSALRIAKSSGSDWLDIGGGGATAATGFITSASFTSFSDFVLASAKTLSLPLTWLSFKATKKTASIELTWQTEKEYDTKNFVVEKSTDGQKWNPIGTVNSNNDWSQSVYTFTDANPAPVNFYRIRQVDVDGQFTYSKIVQAQFSAPSGELAVYPSVLSGGPVKCIIKDEALLRSAQIALRIYDLSGKLVYTSNVKPVPVLSLSCAGLTAGQYVIVAQGENQMQRARIVVQ